ncbi:MAG: preQ(1) synthase [Candidatus Omnitrophica bacterium]|nr:preQ(1) synthase [Candidatus Omnitrophota bacterium]MBU4589701.1 preQ(1) synthase [Candidatus Omnitrophota bacterium]
MPSYQGLQKNIRKLKTPKIEVWRNQYTDKDYVVILENPEFTCVCPKTGLPDFANITIKYNPNKWCVELKSFKLYLIFYRNIGIFHEHAINRILDDFVNACKPGWACINGEFNVRGGIKTTVSAEYKRS